MALGIHRRVFLKSGALFALGSALPPFLATRLAAAKPAQGGAESKVLVCIFMRGGVDGLHMVPPIAEPEYYKERSSIALPEPGKGTGSALALDHRFGLHPKLASLLPLYREGRLAMVHAVGSPHPTRSHFDAQDYMENGTPGSSSSREGWLNRAMQLSSRADAAPLRAVAMNNALPRALTGRAPAIAIDDFKTFGLRGGPVRQRLEQGFQVLYSEPSDAITRSGNEALALIDFVRAKIPRDPKPGHGAEYPRSGRPLLEVADLIKSGVGVEFAWVDLGGWDTHTGQGAADGALGNRLKELGDSLAAFNRDLGAHMKDVVVLTMSEFGRTVAQNGTGGTDHGHGTVMLVLGGRVKGGKVHGRWPGLSKDQRFEGRDLAVTTDFRDLFSEILVRHVGIRDPSAVFPDHSPAPAAFPGVLA